MAAPNTRGDYPRRTAAKFTRTICQQILNGIARKVMISTRNIAGFARWPSLKTVRGVTIVLLLIEIAVSKVAAGTMQHLPCVRAANQLYCPTAGSLYPNINLTEPIVAGHKFSKEKTCKRERIDSFIDDNKSMIRRMFGNVDSPSDPAIEHFQTYDGRRIHHRGKRAANVGGSPHKVDACESTVEIVTPYWASNSHGKIRAIVNTQHLQQAIQTEMCQNSQTRKCNADCGCEQKYKWHRLLAYDPDDDCKGIFMDWFLFPSCCVCRCQNLLQSHSQISKAKNH
ncbi:protein spaetzle 3-like [Varroa jacobsoni]|uniref:protein spaetzle 3-like n=1 Tax=Varroa jacobsoni TaxID=62625 RepID=UPI000BF956B7|nr:protein spaetzle 3-like [Varroa jacobsoni]